MTTFPEIRLLYVGPVLDLDVAEGLHGKTGLLFRDEAEFERGAAALTGDPELRGRLGRAGREVVMRRYSPQREFEGYREVYRGLIEALV